MSDWYVLPSGSGQTFRWQSDGDYAQFISMKSALRLRMCEDCGYYHYSENGAKIFVCLESENNEYACRCSPRRSR